MIEDKAASDGSSHPMQRPRSDADDAGATGASLKAGNSLARSFYHAAQGVRAASRERNFRIDVAVAVCALVAAALLRVDAQGWAAIVVCIGVVLSFETMNTALEAAVDLASPEIHPLAKAAKDCAAGAALIAACMSVVVGLIVFGTALARLVG